jgi:hypothetical protein
MTLQLIKKIGLAPFAAPLLLVGAMQSAMAAHPLVTDDTGTQGTGNSQLEMNSDRATARDNGAQTVGDVTYSYGITPSIDLFADQPLNVSAPRGIGDTSLGFKWRFFENDDTSVALKSSLSMANANDEKGFGSGRNNLAATLIVAHASGPWVFYYNLGMNTNRFKSQDVQDENRRSLWATSAAATYEVLPQLKIVGDIGIARNPDVSTQQNPAFALTGLIYSPRDNVDLDAGIKYGLNNAAIKHQFGAGLTVRF